MEVTYLEHNPYLDDMLSDIESEDFDHNKAEILLSAASYVDSVQVQAFIEGANVKGDESQIFPRMEDPTPEQEESELMALYKKAVLNRKSEKD
jgi:hypothetical protein